MASISEWLTMAGLERYVETFVANGIDLDVLPDMTEADLRELGLSLGDRKRFLKNVAPLPTALSNARIGEPETLSSDPVAHRAGAERRQVSVMFCDLVGFTALSTRLDPEDLRGIIGAYHRGCAEVITKSGGFIAKYMGDGVLAYFGYPQAHEDDAERAVRAGLALVDAVAKLDVGVETRLRVRVGIATGVVVVGDLLGEGAAQEQAVVGETPNLAARLQTLAEADTVVIGVSTHRLLGDLFEYRDLGARSIKGFGDPVPVWQVTGASVVDSRFEALRATTTSLVGRDEEIDLLMRRWEQVKGGEGCVVLISGEAGIGKSRITQTILERLRSEPHTPLRLFCSPHHQDSALYPTITQFERGAGFRREDTDEQRLDKLKGVLAQAANDLHEALPLLAALLSIPTGDRYPPINFSPQKQTEKTLKALLAQVEALAARQTVLMVFEDAHWIDPTSLELLDLIIDQVPTLPILLIVTFRPEFAPAWIGRPHVTLLSLNRLGPRRRVEMIGLLTGGKALPKEIADQIIDRTDGVPLFIEELTKAVVESGVLADAGDRYTVAGPSPPLAIPTTLNASLLARLDRLRAPAREVAQIGAALGRQFSHELISAVASMPQRQLDDALAHLVSTELIFRRGSPPDAEYTFKHALVQDAAYSTLLHSGRQQLHGQITTALEGQFPEIVEMQPELLARHCAEAGLVGQAVGYWLKAGQKAIARCAMTEAVAQLGKGLNLLSGLPDGAARQEQELDLQIARGTALLATKGHSAPEPGEAFARARQLCEQLDRPAQLGRVLAGQSLFRLVRGELVLAENHAEEILQLGEARNDVTWKYFGSSDSGHACSLLGKFIDARAHYENALSLWDPVFRASVASPDDPHVQNLIFLSRTLLCLGYVDQARLRRDEALAEARRLSPFNLAYALCQAWYGDWAIEGVKAAQTNPCSADEVLAITSEHGFAAFFGTGNIMRGWCLGTMGHAAEGIPLLLQGIAIRRATGANLAMPFFFMMLAEVCGMAAQPQEGLNRLAEAAKLVETTQERWAEAEMLRLRGTLLLSTHEHAGAEDSYRLALIVARRQNAKFWELRAARDLARLWRDKGKCTEARDLLAPVYAWFTEGFDTPDLIEAKTLLNELLQ